MKIKKGYRKGFGLAQIMALLLVVLPTIAFIMTLLLDYWNVMQIDYKLKIISNLTADYANNQENIGDFGNTAEYTSFKTSADRLCPKGTSLSFDAPADGSDTGQIDITIQYHHDGPYLKNKTLSTRMQTYSYHDQNMTVVGTCQ